MIHIYRAASDMGVALFDLDTEKFIYGELCNRKRLVDFLNNFPDHPVTIFVEKDWVDELEELFYLVPHLQDISKVEVRKQVNVKDRLAKNGKESKKRNLLPFYIALGIMLGCLILVPTSMEYRASVLTKAQSMEGFTENFVNSQPNELARQQLYTSLDNLYSLVRVEAVTYSLGTFKVVFSSAHDNITVDKLPGFEEATIRKVSSLENASNSSLHIYELEGNL